MTRPHGDRGSKPAQRPGLDQGQLSASLRGGGNQGTRGSAGASWLQGHKAPRSRLASRLLTSLPGWWGSSDSGDTEPSRVRQAAPFCLFGAAEPWEPPQRYQGRMALILWRPGHRIHRHQKGMPDCAPGAPLDGLPCPRGTTRTAQFHLFVAAEPWEPPQRYQGRMALLLRWPGHRNHRHLKGMPACALGAPLDDLPCHGSTTRSAAVPATLFLVPRWQVGQHTFDALIVFPTSGSQR
ncbi:hypothetical protein NDU88_000939 [Pleurodeles waltl]|uniref:Uncharacterized protein n=1 Tax=Pleurodeles waltl TaxID=8319 RepID=A0AAV7NHL5_PLEWA|nr:hypothetical protein NDU88_000939 [Pleurodeles waltl]